MSCSCAIGTAGRDGALPAATTVSCTNRSFSSTVGASTIVIGASTHGGLPALMDGSASHELARHARSNVLVVNPDAPAGVPAEDLWRELAKDG